MILIPLLLLAGLTGTHVNLPADAYEIDDPEVLYLKCIEYNSELPDAMSVCDTVTREIMRDKK